MHPPPNHPPHTEDVTVAGITRRVAAHRDTPKAPPDWDHRRAAAAMAGTVLVVAGALAWSTYAIGTLLSGQAPAALAYSVAAAFDLAWILTGAREYELRFQPSRTKGLRAFGWVLLAGSATVVFHHRLAIGYGDLRGELDLTRTQGPLAGSGSEATVHLGSAHVSSSKEQDVSALHHGPPGELHEPRGLAPLFGALH